MGIVHKLDYIWFFVAVVLIQCWSVPACFGQLSADAGSNKSICQVDQADLGGTPSASRGTAPYTYSWSPRAGLSCVACANPVATPTTTTTYTLTVKDAEDNTEQDQVTVTINPNPILTDEFGSTEFTQCTGADFTLTVFDKSIPANNSNFSISWGDGTPDFTANSFPSNGVTHTFPSGQNYLMTYEITGANGCTSGTEIPVTNITNPGVGVELPEGTVGCGPKNICFPITGFENNDPTTTYEISFGDGADTSFTHPPPSQICHLYSKESCTQPSNSFTFIINATNNCLVSTAEADPIQIFTTPIANFTVNTGCINEANTFSNETLDGFNSSCQSNARYDWDFGDGTNVSVFDRSAQSHIYTAPGDYIVKLITTNSCGFSEFTDTMKVGLPAVSSFELNVINECAPNGEIELINTSSPQNSNNQYEWTIDPERGGTFRSSGTGVSSQVNDIIDFQDPGTYTITLKFTNDCNEFISSQEVVTGEQSTISPANILNLPEISCAPFTLDITTDLVTSDATDYQWELLGAQVTSQPDPSNIQTPGQVMLPPGDYTIQLTIFNDCGASNTTSKNFSVIDLDVVDAGEDMTVCDSEQSVQLMGSPSGGSWKGLCVTPDGAFNPACAVAAADVQELIYTVGSGSCEISDTLEITITASPSTNAGTSRSFCVSATPFDLESEQDADPLGGIWRINNVASTVFDPGLVGIGTYEIEYSFSEPGETCEGIDIVMFTVTGAPDIDAGEARSLCIDTAPFNLDSKQNPSPSGGTWTVNGLETNIFDPSLLGLGTHEVEYSFIGASNECEGVEKIIFTISELPQVSAGPEKSLCIDDSPYDLGSQNASPPGGVWLINGIASSVVNPSVLGAGTHDILYTYRDPATQCEASSLIDFTIIKLSEVGAGEDLEICLDQGPFDLSSKGDISLSGGEWSGPGVTNGMFDPMVTDIGAFDIIYTIKDPNSSCTVNDVITIEVFDSPQVNAGRDVTLCSITAGLTFRGYAPNGGVWDGPGIINPIDGIFSAYESGEGNHTVYYSFTNKFGCTQSDSLVVTVCTDPEVAVQIPTAFTPNGDQLNDTFAPVLDATTEEYRFQIASRSNQIVFETSDPTARWDGSFNSNTSLHGVFAYRLFVRFTSGLEVEREGEVLVIR